MDAARLTQFASYTNTAPHEGTIASTNRQMDRCESYRIIHMSRVLAVPVSCIYGTFIREFIAS